MPGSTTRRRFLTQAGAIAVGVGLSEYPIVSDAWAQGEPPKARVAIGRDERFMAGRIGEHRQVLASLLDAALQRVTGAATAEAGWREVFDARDRVGIKVNTLGFSTNPVVAEVIAAALLRSGIPAENIIIWDRFDVELQRAGFKLNNSNNGVQCRGTDGDRIGSGYQRDVEISGGIGSCYSHIAAEHVDTLISVPVLKDHNLAGVSLGLKNFYGAIHNPNKYHDHNCDPYIADVASHRFIRPKWKLTVIDGTRAQYNAGPGIHPGFAWPFGGLIVSTDLVAADAVAADLLEAERRERGVKSLAEEDRPPTHIRTAARKGLGIGELSRIERINV